MMQTTRDSIPVSTQQFSIRHLFVLTAMFGLLSIGVQKNWPDYLGIVWLGLLISLIYSSCRQILSLATKQNLPSEETKNSTRWIWITFRGIGVVLLTLVILNPFDITDLEDPERIFATQLWSMSGFVSATILRKTGQSLMYFGILFCSIPLWRFRRTGPSTPMRSFLSGSGSVLAILFVATVLFLTRNEPDTINALIFYSIHHMDLAAPVRFAGTEMLGTEPDWIENRYLFSIRCSWLAGFSAIALIACGLSIWQRGAKRYFALIVWCIGAVGASQILVWIYSEGAASLSRSWHFGVGWPDKKTTFLLVCIAAVGGLILTISGNRNTKEDLKPLNLEKLRRFAPLPFVMLMITLLLTSQLFVDYFAFANVNMLRSSWPTFAIDLFSPDRTGPIRDSVSEFYGNKHTAIIWAITFGLIFASHLNLSYWTKRSDTRFFAHAMSMPASISVFLVNWGVATVTLVISALGIGWFSFGSLIYSAHMPVIYLYERIPFPSTLYFCFFILGFVAAIVLFLILVFQMLRKKKIHGNLASKT